MTNNSANNSPVSSRRKRRQKSNEHSDLGPIDQSNNGNHQALDATSSETRNLGLTEAILHGEPLTMENQIGHDSIMLEEGGVMDLYDMVMANPTDNQQPTPSASSTPANIQENTAATEQPTTRRKRASSTASTKKSSKSKKKKESLGDDEGSTEHDDRSNDTNEEQDYSTSHNRNNLLPNQRGACPAEEVPPNEQGRFWILEVPPRRQQSSSESEFNDVIVRVTMKIRGEEAKNFVPSKLYSSHKYVIMHEILGKSLIEKYPLIVSRIHVINPSTREELKNSKNPNKLCLMGTMETALTKTTVGGKKSKDTSESEVVKGQMKVQFSDVSYHHEKGHFGFIINYFNPANLEDPLFSLVAPPFSVFARKPTNENQTETLQPTKPKSTKRKRKSDADNDDNLSSSDQTVTSTSGITAAPAASEEAKKKTRRQTKKTTSTTSRQQNEDQNQQVIPTVHQNTVAPAIAGVSHNMIEFTRKLEAVKNIKKQLSQEASKKASEMALTNLLSLDAQTSQNFILGNTLAQQDSSLSEMQNR